MENGQYVGSSTRLAIDELLVAADPPALAREAAARFARIAQKAVARLGRVTLVLAGGSTPERLYACLASEPYRTELPWHKTHIFWSDERAVPPEHPDSNFGMAKRALLDRVPVPADRIHRMQAERSDLDGAASDYQAEIAMTFAVTPAGEPPAFDLILLGLGRDGHTASLFPSTQALRETRRWVCANHIPMLKTNRLTLTPPILNRAMAIVLLVSGVDKAPILQAVLRGPADPGRLPIHLVRPASGRLIWLVDQDAAKGLSGRA